MPALWGYTRDLYQTPGFGENINFDSIKQHYYGVHNSLNPSGIIPLGPITEPFSSPHYRDQLGGLPFGEGTPPISMAGAIVE